MREYEKSHNWITFQANLSKLSYKTWMALGEARSKCELISNTPLNPDVSKAMHSLYLAKGARGTTAIEGNTLSEQEVLDNLDGKLELPPSKEYLKREIDNIVEACNVIRDEVISASSPELSIEKLENYNGMVLKGLEVEGSVIPGKIRSHPVGVSGARYKGAPAEDCIYLVDKLCNWLNNDFKVSSEFESIPMGIIKAAIAHVYIAWIHPFGDGNGRTARLVEFQVLLASGMPTTTAHLLSNYYNETRNEYYRQLQKTSISGGDIIPFIEYAVIGLVDELKNQLDLIRKEVFRVTWITYIHEQFRGKNTESDIRRRDLTLDISVAHADEKSIDISNVKNVSPRIASRYTGLAQRTLSRDLAVLREMKLILSDRDGRIHPNYFIIFAFLPRRRESLNEDTKE